MPVYNIGFSKQLLEAAKYVYYNDQSNPDATRTSLYLSLLSCEIALKAVLENCGFDPDTEIRKLSHNLLELKNKIVTSCEVEEDVKNVGRIWRPAHGFCGIPICAEDGSRSTVGNLLCGEEKGASKYPTEIRYGVTVVHYPPDALLKTAEALVDWVSIRWENMRRKADCLQPD